MKRNAFAVGFPLALSAVVLLGTTAFAPTQKPAAPKSMAAHETGSMALRRIMERNKSTPMPMTGNVDKDFATLMSMHHEMGIRMMDVMLQQGHNPQLKALAAKMKADQQDELRQMVPYTQ